jgi:5'-nucleotidase
MKIIVNNAPLILHTGAKVRDAVLKYYSEQGIRKPEHPLRVEDPYGNIVANDGELTEGNILFIKTRQGNNSLVSRLLLATLLIGLLCGCNTGKKQAILFAVNDMHAEIDNFPKLAYVVDSLRAIYPDMLLISAGDNQTGNPVNDQHPEKGLPMIELMNALGFDLSAVGNHEFDTRPHGFGNLTQKADFEFICANMSAHDSINIKVSPFKIITLTNGLKLAFLGLLQINQNGIPDTHPENVKGFSFTAPFEAAPNYLYLKDQSDIFIAVTHLGFENDVQLAERMPAGIDLIIGGHSHTKVEEAQIHNGILITQAQRKLKYGTLIKLVPGRDGQVHRQMELIDIENSRNAKASIRAMVDEYNDDPVLEEVIATALDDFSSKAELGYLMADAQRYAAKADIALVNPGGVRLQYLAKGPITLMHVYQLDPFGNELILTELTGHEIRDLMLAAFPVDENLPLFPSGIKTRLELDADGKLRDVVLLSEGSIPLDMDKSYWVAMNNYMTQVYNYAHSDPGQSLYIETADAIISYLKKDEELRSYKGENRIQIN